MNEKKDEQTQEGPHDDDMAKSNGIGGATLTTPPPKAEEKPNKLFDGTIIPTPKKG